MSQDNCLMDKHDQEMHMTGNAQKEHELKFTREKPWNKQSTESTRSSSNGPITGGFNKKQPIKTPEIKRWWQNLKQASGINTATFGQKISLFDSLCRGPGVAVKPLRKPKRQQWSGKTGLSEWIPVRPAQKIGLSE